MSNTNDAAHRAARRDFLRASAAAVGAAMTLPLAAVAAGCASTASTASTAGSSTGMGASTAATTTTTTTTASRATATRVPGIQLYTARSLMQNDVEGTLTALAGIGYKEFEFAGYFGRDPKALRRTLDGLGVTAPSVHVPLDTLRTALGPALDAAATLGHQYVICPYVMDPERNAEGFRRIADDLGRIGQQVKARGMQLAYHNHDFEFKPLADGQLPYDLLLTRTDASLVQMELDLYWITYAGRDPMAYISANPGRFSLVHAKDLSRTGGTAHMADVGQGTIDFKSIFSRAQFKHYFVERDDTTDPLASARVSVRALQALLA